MTAVDDNANYEKAQADPLAALILEALHEQDALYWNGRSGERMGERALAVAKQIRTKIYGNWGQNW